MRMGPKTIEEYTEAMRRCLEEAQQRLLEHGRLWNSRIRQVDLEEMEIDVWSQDWSTSSCGFGGVGTVSPCSATTLVARYVTSGAYTVFHDFRFAYLVERPSELFFRHLENKRLVGAAEDHAAYEREWDREGFRLV